MHYYNKDEIKEELSIDDIYSLLSEWGGEPEYRSFGLISATICHNLPGCGSKKLYYYSNTKLFKCYTDCPEDSFDIFELAIKVARNQYKEQWELYDAMKFIGNFFGLKGNNGNESFRTEDKEVIDWDLFKKHNFEKDIERKNIFTNICKIYDNNILKRFSYLRIKNWEDEGISKKACQLNNIGYYAGGEQITIPHYDIDGKLIGIRGRTLGKEEAEKYGKYRPLYVNHTLYSHPLSLNLYNLNYSKENIKKAKVAVIYESEKSTLLHKTYYGADNDVSVACCGSNISSYQIDLLTSLGVQEVIIAFDRQFQEKGDNEFKRLKDKLIKFHLRYGQKVKISFIFDKDMLTPYKASPIDCGKDLFEFLLKNRISL